MKIVKRSNNYVKNIFELIFMSRYILENNRATKFVWKVSSCCRWNDSASIMFNIILRCVNDLFQFHMNKAYYGR